jgi:hypothetical protein
MIRIFIRLMVFAAFLAGWEVYGKPLYLAYLEAQGAPYGFGEAMIGYMIPLALATLVAAFLNRRLHHEGEVR